MEEKAARTFVFERYEIRELAAPAAYLLGALELGNNLKTLKNEMPVHRSEFNREFQRRVSDNDFYPANQARITNIQRRHARNCFRVADGTRTRSVCAIANQTSGRERSKLLRRAPLAGTTELYQRRDAR